MNDYLKMLCCFLLIWGVEMAAAWLCIDLIFPPDTEQFSHSIAYGYLDSASNSD